MPDYALVFGNPARLRGWVGACGVKIEFAGREPDAHAKCPACGAKYLNSEEIVRPAT